MHTFQVQHGMDTVERQWSEFWENEGKNIDREVIEEWHQDIINIAKGKLFISTY